MGVVIRADDIQLRSIEGCGDASEVEQQMGQCIRHHRTVFRYLNGLPAVWGEPQIQKGISISLRARR